MSGLVYRGHVSGLVDQSRIEAITKLLSQADQEYGQLILATADHQFGLAADRAFVLAALETIGAGKLARLVIGMLADRQAEPFCHAIVADRIGRQSFDQPADLVQYRYAAPHRTVP